MASKAHLRTAWNSAALTLFVSLLIGLPGCQRAERPTQPSSQKPFVLASEKEFVPDSRCRDCHEAIYDSYQDVAMSQSLYRFDSRPEIESFESGQNVLYHERSNRHYEMSVRDKTMFVTRFRQREDGTRFAERTHKVDYVIGSGNHVRGYLYQNDAGELFEIPIVWYTQKGAWGMAPGFDSDDHHDFDRPITRQCMFCHNAYPELKEGADAFGMPHNFPQQLPHGIGCQRCHGPGSMHINHADDESEENIRSTIVNPARLSRDRAEDVCLQCHLQPSSRRSSVVGKFDKGDFAYRPGRALVDYLAHVELDEDTHAENRFDINHHPYRLHQSACYLNSDGRLSCTSCHDPHSVIPEGDRVAHFRKACRTCHASDACNSEQGRAVDAHCVSCHMPKRRTEDVVHVAMTDHRIGLHGNLDALTEPLEESELSVELALRPHARSEREKVYALVAGARDRDLSAIRDLEALVRNRSDAPIELLLQLGQAQLETSSVEAAIETLHRALDSDPNCAFAHENLGVAYMSVGDPPRALQHLNTACQLNPARPESRFNHGLVLAKLGDERKARVEYKMALKLRPDYAKCRFNLGNLLARNNEFEKARDEFQRVIELDPDDVNAYGNLSAVLLKLDDRKGAVRVLQDGLISVPGNEALQRALDKVAGTHRVP